ncbi:MAG: DUF3737 family protein [Bacilli bacterium]|nr:DUF3737 family protein [Bacilli bacterium]
MKKVSGGTYDEERAFYGLNGIEAENISIDGPKDGESAFKECSDVSVRDSYFNLRYPFWHDHGLNLKNIEMTDKCRAAIWYSDHIDIRDSKMHGIKALRECSNIYMSNVDVISPEFGWSVDNIKLDNVTIESEYLFMRSKNLKAEKLFMKGKYSFQYFENAEFDNCEFKTKDAFWHSKNVTVRNSYIDGEYLGWYSENLTLINCTIEGTQPLCYCKNLKLIDCKMIRCDLSFERSEVEANIIGNVDSIKNPLQNSHIIADSVGEIIHDIEAPLGEIEIRN